MDQNLSVYNQYVQEYNDYSLYPVERVIIEKFKHRWSQMRMLDIGIGTGRSTYTFASIVGTYVGIDYAEEMLKRCRTIVPENNDVSFHHCDARDLSKYYDQQFDFVLFSLNGLDSVGHDDRQKILEEVKKILAPDGCFFFSTHSVRGFTRFRSPPKFNLSKPVHSVYYLAKNLLFNARLKWRYKHIRQSELEQCDWTVLKTGDHDFKIDIYHVLPEFQLQELARLGFHVDAILDPQGRTVDPTSTTANWLYFLCKPATTSTMI